MILGLKQFIPMIAALATAMGMVLVVSCKTHDSANPAKPDSQPSRRTAHKLPPPTINRALVSSGRHGRHRMLPMTPRYITIHSTQNYSLGADAFTHAELLRNGGLKSEHNYD